MLPEQIHNHREVVTLRDGTYILLRPMVQADRSHLDELFSRITEEDLNFFRHNVKDPALLQAWCDDLNYNRILPLLALAKDQAVGIVTLHFFEGPRRHIGEIRLFLAKDFRKRGLGMKMARAMIELARKQGLKILYGEIIADQPKVVKAFEQLGFKVQCKLEEFFMFPDGETTDVMVVTLPLTPKLDEF
ncbi:MAG: GNAT family N-acetyltransferase [Chloroflexi bacterium]|nr:GNAT family N-acetyltransferase [Chloroflexota bacterium]